MKTTETEQNPEIKKAVDKLANTINSLLNGFCNVAKALAKIVKSGTFQSFINAVNKPFLTPRQYFLMQHGKKRVRAKWLNVARKRLEKNMKQDANNV